MRKHGRARVNPRHPEPAGICDRCGGYYSLADLRYQMEYAGQGLRNTGWRVCSPCTDRPNPQLKAIILPPDPEPVRDPRPDPWAGEQPNFIATDSGVPVYTEGGRGLVEENGA